MRTHTPCAEAVSKIQTQHHQSLSSHMSPHIHWCLYNIIGWAQLAFKYGKGKILILSNEKTGWSHGSCLRYSKGMSHCNPHYSKLKNGTTHCKGLQPRKEFKLKIIQNESICKMRVQEQKLLIYAKIWKWNN